ncbi:uncharacterized protein Tco025E_03872 [Trypanosoma conorhini]|uniref:Raptor N-terminal CASPase-like domain-containing protein n=1 Tax=Trypanosoma conorhini TaxID=83891 RepID=A0A3R7LBH5_9TRYP|nr:uncharacterized protein Tco025E_03872 [Trypanosoma conorhini]RNF20127.1 hypothetical protein Tco025E_03872 [Trypanosoma conorhini]
MPSEKSSWPQVETAAAPLGLAGVTTGFACNEADAAQVIPLQPRTDAELEAMERQRWGRMVQEGVFHQTLHFQRWDKEALLRGLLYHTRAVAARTTVRPTTTAALVLSLNISPVLLSGENEGERGEEVPPKASRLYAWRAPALLPGDRLNILSQLGQRLESQYRSLSKRSLTVGHCLNARQEDLVRALAQCRHQAGPKSKVLVHYGGHGVPRPGGGSLYLQSPSGDAVKYSLDTFCSQVGFPLIMVAECENAVSVLHHLLENRQKGDIEHSFSYRQYGTTIGGSALEEPERPYLMVPGWDRYEVASVSGMEGATATPPSSAAYLSALRCLGSAAAPAAPPLLFDDFFFLGASEDGALPQHPKLPSDIFTSCLTTPVRMALLWFIVQNAQTADVHPLLMYLLPGELNDKKTPLGALQWAFMSITECIAWSTFPHALFMHLFREDVVAAPLFRGFLLADRIITALGAKLTVYPPLPRTSDHTLWDTLDNVIDRTLVSLWRAVRPTPPTMLNALEFREWLDWSAASWQYDKGSMTLPSLGDRAVVVPDFLGEEFACLAAVVERITEQGFTRLVSVDKQRAEFLVGSATARRRPRTDDDSPLLFFRMNAPGNGNSSTTTRPFPHVVRLPMLLQGLLVMSHREEATELVCRFVDAGPLAVTACAEVGIFHIALVHYWSRPDLRHLLPTMLFVYAKACHTDPSLGDADPRQRNLIIDTCMELLEHPFKVPAESTGEAGAWQRDVLGSWAEPDGQRLLAAALLTMLCLHSSEARRRCREHDALRVCCKLLRDAAAKTPSVRPHAVASRGEGAGAEGEEGSGSEGNLWEECAPDGTDSNPVPMTTHLLGLIAFLVAIAWEGPLSVAAADEKEEAPQQQPQQESYEALALREHLSTAIEALQALSSANASAVRGAATKAITVLLLSHITDEETAIMCVRSITGMTAVELTPSEANTDNRLEFVGALSVATRWLISHLSFTLPLGEIRRELRREMTKVWRTVFGALAHDAGEDDASGCGSDGRLAAPSPPASASFSGVDELLRILARLTCRLTVATKDPCPLVAAHAQKVLRDELSMFHVRHVPFLQTSGNAPCGRADAAASSRHSAIATFFSGVLSTLTSRGGKPTPRDDRQGGGQVLLDLEGEDTVEEMLEAGGVVGGGKTASDHNLSLRTVSVDDNWTISSFVYTLLSFLGELLLIPMDDHDPRHPFNLEKDAHLLKYLRQLRDELRVAAAPGYGARGYEGHVLASPWLPAASPQWSHPPGPSMPSQEDESRGHTPSLSSLLNLSSSASVDAAAAWTTDRQYPYRLLAERHTLVERHGRMQVLTFHPTERHCITGTSQGVIQVWSFADVPGASLASTAAASGPSPVSGEPCRLMAQIPLSEVVARPRCAMPPSTVLRYMYDTQPTSPHRVYYSRSSGEEFPAYGACGAASEATLPRRRGLLGSGDYGERGTKGADPLTGLHLVDSAYRTLLCAVGRSGSVQLFSGYTDAATVRRVTTFLTMTHEESLRSHQCLSSYHAPAMLLHLTSGDGSITSWDLNCELRVLEGAGRAELVNSPSALASHPYDVFTFAVGAGSVYLYDLRRPSRSTHVLPDPTSLGQPLQRQERRLCDHKPLCLHIGFSCRYPHGLVTGHGGERGVVMVWDDRNLQQPLFQRVVSDTGGASSPSFHSVGYMDVQHYHYALTTLSVTADALCVEDALDAPSSPPPGAGGGGTSRTHIRLKQQPAAASFHPVLPLCGVAGGGFLQLYGRKKVSMSDRHA